MKRFASSAAFRYALLYILISALYILFSDRIAAALISDAQYLTVIQTYKGWAFVVISGMLVAFLLHRETRDRIVVEQDFQALFENAVEGIFQSTPDGRFLRVNSAMARIYGYASPEEMLNEIQDIRSQIYIKPHERDEYVDLLNNEGVVVDFEGHNRRRDGSLIWTSTNARVVRDDHGKILYYEGFIQDITERVRTEKLEDAIYQISRATVSTRSLEELFQFIHLALATILPAENFYIALYDKEEDLLTFPYFVDQYDEPSPPQKPGRGLTEYVLRTNTPLLASPDVFRQLLADGEVEIVGVDSIDWLGVPLAIDGQAFGVMVVQSYAEGTRYGPRERDILSFISTQAALAIQRKRAETALLESEERYRRVVDSSPIGILIHNNGKIVFLNSAAMKKLGAEKPEQILERPILEFVHPETLPRTMERMKRMLAGEEVDYPVEDVYLRLDGTSVPVEVTAVRTTFQSQPAVQVMINDISDRKRARQTLTRQLQEMKVLNDVASVCARATDVDELIAQTTQIVGESLYPDSCGVLLAEPALSTWHPHHTYIGIDQQFKSLMHPYSEGIVGKAAASGEIIRVGDTKYENSYFSATPGIQSELAVPIIVSGQVYGVLNVESRQIDAFNEHDEHLLATIADSLATSIEKIHLLHSEQKRRREAEILSEASLALTGPLDLASRLEVILDKLPLFARFDSASIMLENLDEMEIVAGRGLPEDADLIGRTLPRSAKWSEMISSKKPLIVPDAQAESRFFPLPGTEYIRGWMSIPLVAYDRVIGFINLDSRKVNAFDEEQAALIQTFAQQAAVALENARLYEAEQRRRKENARLLDELQINTLELSMAYDKTLEGWARALEIRDKETLGHTRRVTELTLLLARQMGVSESEIPHIRRGVLLHDIGKMGIPDHILKKTGPLLSSEWDEMRRHPQYAFDLLYPIAYLRPALDIPYCHHEKWDGTGYPRGLKGEQIPMAARIFSVVDVWDALLHDRPYRAAWSRQKTVDYISQENGKYFDPRVVQAFLELIQ